MKNFAHIGLTNALPGLEIAKATNRKLVFFYTLAK